MATPFTYYPKPATVSEAQSKMYKNIYEEIDTKVRLLEEYAFCALATGQYVEAGVVEDSAALLVRLKIILKTLDQSEEMS